MNQEKISKIFIVLFMAIIIVPLACFILRIKIEPINKNDKKISLNFARNFPLKSDLFDAFAVIKSDVFDTNPIPGRAIDMKNGWKFLGNDFSNALSESKGLVVFTKSELVKLKKSLENRQKWLNDRGIKFYVAIAPNKHSVYGDMIPIAKASNNTKREQVDSICNVLGINYIDLGAKFPKNSKIRLYHRTDTHWNDYGGFFAHESTMELIKKDFKDSKFNTFTLDDMDMRVTIDPIGDLNQMLQLKKNEEYIRLDFKEPEQAIQLEKQLQVPRDYHKNPLFYETRYKNDINDLKVLVFNDSFFGYYSKYLKENFGSSVFIWNYKFDKEIIEKEKPDILYHEILERDVDFLIDNYIPR
ncbi:hypothetical protein [Aquimarina sp. MMG016]|uniref:alginate O-acetyltransferase AlgX-related protein n=1 Tax=Aquimarina sp. MMG016 TaxID=2822690 RepID=UPI001B3A0C61|nr:hypothetical protein [Aquimarina sp. MMG016]MBQ4820290.1 hypothetical protein [Aquimarina sp. MMG016]